MRTSVVVGVDGSAQSIRAALAAGDLAVRHGLSLRVLHVFSWPVLYPPFLPPSVGCFPRPGLPPAVPAAVGRRPTGSAPCLARTRRHGRRARRVGAPGSRD